MHAYISLDHQLCELFYLCAILKVKLLLKFTHVLIQHNNVLMEMLEF